MKFREGKYTVERFAEENHITRQSALNLLSKLKKEEVVTVSGGGKQKRIYAIHQLPKRKTNGFYDVVNRYSPEKLQPKFKHYITGNYTTEHAIIDGIRIGDSRTLEATKYLFRHVTNWKRLFNLARKEKIEKQVIIMYNKARETIKCKRIPQRYIK